MKRRSTHIRDDQARALSDLMRESRESERFPTLDSEAEVFRRLLDFALERADLADLLSEEVRVKVLRERFVEDEATVRDWRTGFETRVKREFKKRWENGYGPEKLEEYAENFHREADIIWPEWSAEDYSERREEAHEYIEAVKKQAIEAAETSEFDPLDPEQMFSTYEGVETAREAERAERETEPIRRDARQMLSRGRSEQFMVSRLSDTYPVTESEARAVISDVRDTLADAQGGVADD